MFIDLTDTELDALRDITQNPTILKAIRAMDDRRAIVGMMGDGSTGGLQPMVAYVRKFGGLNVCSGRFGGLPTKDFRGLPFVQTIIPKKRDGTPDKRRKPLQQPVATYRVAGTIMTADTWATVAPQLEAVLNRLDIPFDDRGGKDGIRCKTPCAVEKVWVAVKDITYRSGSDTATVNAGVTFREFNIHRPSPSGTCDGGHNVGPMSWFQFCNIVHDGLEERIELVALDDNYASAGCRTVQWARHNPGWVPTILRQLGDKR